MWTRRPYLAFWRQGRWSEPFEARSSEIFRRLKEALPIPPPFPAHPFLEGEEAEGARRTYLSVFKTVVAEEQRRIEDQHRKGAGGLQIVAELTTLADAVIGHLFRLAEEALGEGRRKGEGCALIALGGYGRRELNPASDIDLMFLLPRRPDDNLQALIRPVLYTLYDIGFVVGHASRSVDDCLQMAEADLSSLTAMLEARFLAGQRGIFERFRRALASFLTGRQVASFIQRKLAEQEARHRKYGASIFLQEPNVKEGVGGLRDLHTALWIAKVRYPIAGWRDLTTRGLLSQEELDQGLETLDFLLRLRNELHYLSRGKNDILSLSLQERVAANLGFSGTGETYAVERLMRHYYLCAREIQRLSRTIVERCLRQRSLVEEAMKTLKAREIGDGFVEVNRQIHVMPMNRGLFAEDPVRLMKIFWYAQQMGYGLSLEARELVRSHLPLIDDDLRRSNRALGFFLAILREPSGVVRILRLMHELGVLSAYIPEFAPLTCLVQFDFYHKYTVDEHTFMALENLEDLYRSESPALHEFRSIAKELKKPELLKLAILFHDLGKGEGKGHVEKGVVLTDQILKRWGFPDQDAEEVKFLVAHHLTMSHIAQHRDLDDEPMIIELAKQVQTVDRLKSLYLLTYLDIKAVGPDVWNEWKAALLWELYLKAHTILTRGVEGEGDLARAAKLKEELTRELADEFPRSVVEEHLSQMPIRYLLTTPGAKVAAHMRLVERVLRGEEVAAQWTHYPLVGYTEFTVCAFGRPGRFSQIVGTLTANGINILGAQMYTRKDGMVIRNFQVNDGRGGAVLEEVIWERVSEDLQEVLTGKVDVRELIKARRKEILVKPSRKGPPPPTRVEFDNIVSESHTVIDVRTQDRLGLLYLISSTLSELGIDVRLAKIATEADQVIDVFYVTERDGRKILEETRLEEVRLALERAIAEGLL